MVSVFVQLKSYLLVCNFFQNFIRGASPTVHIDLVSALQKFPVIVRVIDRHSYVLDGHGALVMMLLMLLS